MVLSLLGCLFGLAKLSFGGSMRATAGRGSCASLCDALLVHKLICALFETTLQTARTSCYVDSSMPNLWRGKLSAVIGSG